MKGLIVLIILIGCSVMFRCKSDNSAESINCGSVSISFASEVKPIIDTKCATTSGCHAAGSNQGPGALTTYAQILNAKNQISASVSSGSMPQGSTLTSDQKNKIICWIQNGAANN